MSFNNHTSQASAKIFIEVTHAKLQKPHLNSVCKNTNIKVLVKAQEKHQLLPAKMCIFPKALCMWPHTKPPYKVLTWLNKDLSKSQFAAPRPWTQGWTIWIFSSSHCSVNRFDLTAALFQKCSVGLCCHYLSLLLPDPFLEFGVGIRSGTTPDSSSWIRCWELERGCIALYHTYIHLPNLCQALTVV